jgi:hypothetical protein
MARFNRFAASVTNTPGTSGSITLGAARTGFAKPPVAYDGLSFTMVYTLPAGGFEVRTGCVYSFSAGTLARGTLEDSSSYSAGVPQAISLDSTTIATGTVSAAEFTAFDTLVSGALISATASTAIPVFVQSNGSVAANGALSGLTALPETFPSVWLYFPAGAVYSGSVAGLYYCQMSSATAGTIFNNILSQSTGQVPYIPSSPTPIAAAGPGAYTQSTSGYILPIKIPGAVMGPNGVARASALFQVINNANSKSCSIAIGQSYSSGTNIHNSTVLSLDTAGASRKIRNRGSQARQISFPAVQGYFSEDNSMGVAPVATTIDTSVDWYVMFHLFIGTATDWGGILGFDISVQSGL